MECYKIIKREAENAHQMSKRTNKITLEDFALLDSEILDKCLYGKDILPGAISVAELALWLASARKDTALTNFQDNFIVEDSLGPPELFEDLGPASDYQKFDLVIGNPPWGGEVSSSSMKYLSETFPGVTTLDTMNSFELFLLVGSKYLKKNGRLCYILPHAFLNPQKREIRKFIMEEYQIEKLHYLGADWFGSDIRMNTLLFQMRNERPKNNPCFQSMILSGKERRSAIRGELSLEQLEASLSSKIPQSRCSNPPDYQIEVFRYLEDDSIMQKMEDNSRGLASICYHSRGVELNKSGSVIECPSCGKWIAPPRPALELRSKKLSKKELLEAKSRISKRCPYCHIEFKLTEAVAEKDLTKTEKTGNVAPYIDGDLIGSRYEKPEYKWIELGIDGINYKSKDEYKDPKVLIRQAGVGLSVCYDSESAYCPRSVYIYRPAKTKAKRDDDSETSETWGQVFSAKFLLGVLNSRLFHYYLFKKYAEIDAAQAFSKVNHEKLSILPIPVRKWQSKAWKENHDEVVQLVEKMLSGAKNGGKFDWKIELILSEMYGLNAKERQYIIGQFGIMEYHKVMRELFPDGKPPRPDKYSSIPEESVE